MRTELGKIKSIRFGHGGYQDCGIGLSIELGGDAWGVGWWMGAWDPNLMGHSEYYKWTESDRSNDMVAVVRKISDMLKEAKVTDITKLKGIPVSCTFEGQTLKDWRILTEVL